MPHAICLQYKLIHCVLHIFDGNLKMSLDFYTSNKRFVDMKKSPFDKTNQYDAKFSAIL